MSHQHDNAHYVRRVVLPSGKTIEVVYFEGDAAPGAGGASPAGHHPAAPTALPSGPGADLHVCGSCDARLVYPMDWDEAGPSHWEVILRCPNCEWTGTGVFDQATVERFDEELDRGMDALVRDLKRLEHANMEAEIERFALALHEGHILPDDF
jgi:hypothetical protein